jgi:hypothetical protein
MGHTLRRLEELLNDGQPEEIRALISPEASQEERHQVERSVAAVMARLGTNFHYYVRSDIGRGAVVPTAPDRVSLQVTGTYVGEGRPDENEAIRLELEAVEDRQRRRWLFRSLAFAGSAPAAQNSQQQWPWALLLIIGLGLVGLVGWWARRLRRGLVSIKQT